MKWNLAHRCSGVLTNYELSFRRAITIAIIGHRWLPRGDVARDAFLRTSLRHSLVFYIVQSVALNGNRLNDNTELILVGLLLATPTGEDSNLRWLFEMYMSPCSLKLCICIRGGHWSKESRRHSTFAGYCVRHCNGCRTYAKFCRWQKIK